MDKLPLKQTLIYATGNLGIALITGMHMLHLVYFFFPPKDAGIPYLIPQSSLLLGLTVLGIVIAITRFFDAFLDPIIANFSDRLNHRLGRRIPMMRFAILPFAMCYTLVFFPPVNGISTVNVIWLFSLLLMSAFFFTSYAIPFYSLMVDIAKRSNEKVDLATVSSSFWYFGFLMVAFTPGLWSFFSETLGVAKVWGMRTTFLCIGSIGILCLSVPAFFIDERKYARFESVPDKQSLLASLRHVLKIRSFRFYLCTNACYSVATYIYESGMIYYLTVLALKNESIQGPVTATIGLATLACYPLVNYFAKKSGKKLLLRISLVLFALAFCVTSLFGQFGLSFTLLIGILFVISPIAQASFGILPQVITSDCATYDSDKTGQDRSGMFMAANGFFAKLGGGLGVILFTSFLLFGKDIGNDMGIRIAAAFGAAIAIVGAFLLSQYDEREILTYMDKYADENDTASLPAKNLSR